MTAAARLATLHLQMRAWMLVLLGVLAASLHTSGSAQEPRRSVPGALRTALEGCWDLGDGQTYVIEGHGAHGLRARWSATSPLGGVEHYAATLYYLPDAHAVDGGCGARSQHGQHCLFTVTDGGAVDVATISSYSGRGSHRTVSRCAAGTAIPEAPTPEVHPVPADAPIAALLTRWRRDIDATRTPTGEEDGWTRYGEDLAVFFDHGVAMRVRWRVAAASCEDAARAAGFTPSDGSFPMHDAHGCSWPGRSARHRLAPHVAGSYRDGVMEIERTQ